MRTDATTRLTATADAFVLNTTLAAYEGDRQVFARSWDVAIERDNV